MVTRAPLRFNVRHDPSAVVPIARFMNGYGVPGTDAVNVQDISTRIEEVTEALLRLEGTSSVCLSVHVCDSLCVSRSVSSGKSGITDTEICIELRTKDCPNLTVIDLPGIIDVEVR